MTKYGHSHSEALYALARVVGGKTEMVYRCAPTAKEAWTAVIDEETLGTGWTRGSLRKAGWRPCRFYVEGVIGP